MKTFPYEFNGQTYHLCMNGAALFDIYDKYGSKGFVTDAIKGTGKKSFLATCWMLAKLCEQGELVRRYQGYDHGRIPTERDFLLMLAPMDVPKAKRAIEEAVRLGFRAEEPEEKKAVDLGLQELQKKTDPS